MDTHFPHLLHCSQRSLTEGGDDDDDEGEDEEEDEGEWLVVLNDESVNLGKSVNTCVCLKASSCVRQLLCL